MAAWRSRHPTSSGCSSRRGPSRSPLPVPPPQIRNFDVVVTSPVTFFVGENGAGKSTVIEAIAALCRLPVSGGGRHDLADRHGPERSSALASPSAPRFGVVRATRISCAQSFKRISPRFGPA